VAREQVAGSCSIDTAPMKPKLSVIVVCLNSWQVLSQALDALAPQVIADDVEVLVVGRWDDRSDDSERRLRYPGVTWISATNESTVPQLRTLGIRRSRGDIVALLEDDCVVTDAWCRAVIRAHAAPFPAIGGAISPGAPYSRLDWAVYFSEYGRFMPPLSGVVSALPGNNVTYKRSRLGDSVEDAGFQEVFFHWRLQQSKIDLIADPSLVVSNVNHWSLRHVTSVPFHHGRAFAAKRSAEFSRRRRMLYGGLAVALPAIKVARLAREVLGRRKYVRPFVRSLHWTFVFVVLWAGGESAGYLLSGGDSASRWR
jgi:glycosyltransferase involved in cell wall biosynthesis